MRIQIITGMFPPIQTGTSFYSRNLAEAFSRKGHKVQVVATKNKLDDVQDYSFALKRIPAIYFPIRNYFKHLRFCSIYPWNYVKVNSITKEFSPDVILLINHYLDIAFPAIFSSLRNRIPLVVSVGTQMQSANKIKNKILNILERLVVGYLIFPFAKKIVSWDKEIQRYITEIHTKKNANKSYIIPYGVNGDISVYKKHIHDYNKIDQIIGIGSIIKQRNYLFPIRVFKELLKYYPNLIYKIVGHVYIDDPKKMVHELGISKNVIFTGEIPHKEVIDEISNSVIGFTITSGLYSGLGTSTIESMLMGVPTFSKSPQDLFGSNAILKDMSNYIFTDGISVQTTTSKIVQLIKDKDLRKEIGTRGRIFVENFMNWDFVAEKYIDLFKSILNEKEQD